MANLRHEKRPDPPPLSLLPMQLQVGDRLVEPTGEWEIAARPFTTNAGKTVHARVRRVDDPTVGGLRSWSVHERIEVRRAG